MNALPYIRGNQCITFITEAGKPVTVLESDPSYEVIIDRVKIGDWEEIERLLDKPATIESFTSGKVEVMHGALFYNGEELHGYVVDQILDFIKEGLDAQPLINFLDKLMDNPSKRCVDQLFTFLQHRNMPIDPDGDFYAYKAVTANWMDKHSGKIDNRVGTIVQVERNKVDDDPDRGCSHGLHAGSLTYVESFAQPGDNMIIVKINPVDVVAVPKTEDNKLRCCRYEVTGLFKGPMGNTVLPEDYFIDDEDDNDEDDYDEDYDY